jgi:hypothetical protein
MSRQLRGGSFLFATSGGPRQLRHTQTLQVEILNAELSEAAIQANGHIGIQHLSVS